MIYDHVGAAKKTDVNPKLTNCKSNVNQKKNIYIYKYMYIYRIYI